MFVRVIWANCGERKNFVFKSLKKDNYDVNIRNKYIFENETNMGCKADIIRYEIVYQYGGIYVDIDSVCITGFDGHFKMPLLSYTDRQRWNNVQNAFFCISQELCVFRLFDSVS